MSSDNRVMDDTGFWRWFDSQVDGLSVREIERRAGVPRGRIGNPRSGGFAPTLEVCQAIADGLVIPLKDILRQAKLVESGHPISEAEESMMLQFRRLPLRDRGTIMTMIQAMVEFYERSPTAPTAPTAHFSRG